MLKELQTLDERAVIKMLEILRNRVAERFPTRGLSQTVMHLLDVARISAKEAEALRYPNWPLRIVWVLVSAAGFYGLVYLIKSKYTVFLSPTVEFIDFAQGLEATFNIVAICSLVLFFCFRYEASLKRRTALTGLYRLRAVSHVIDMHQLTKDPESILGKARTTSSPARDLDQEQLLRYLDYCAEMLSLTGKLAALYSQYYPDGQVVAAVNDVEQLTTNLSRKIWQKIVLVQSTPESD
jgi:hypothetical protein